MYHSKWLITKRIFNVMVGQAGVLDFNDLLQSGFGIVIVNIWSGIIQKPDKIVS